MPTESDEPKRPSVLDFVTDDEAEEVAAPGRSRRSSLFGINRQHLVASGIVLLMLLLALGIGLGIYASSNQGRIYDGVSVAGVDLGGKSRSQARAALDPVLTAFLTEPVVLTSDGNEFTIDPVSAGIGFDVDATIERAYSYGRSGNVVSRFANWSRALLHGADIKPVLTIDTARLDAALAGVADNVIVPPVNAAIVIAGEAGPAIATEWPGVGFDLTETRHLLAHHFTSLSSSPVPLVLIELEPAIARSDLETGLATAQVVMTDGFMIRGPERRVWQLDRNDLRTLMTFASDDGALSINNEAITDLVGVLAEAIDRDTVDATVFVNSDEEIVIRRSVDALLVDQEASVAAFLNALHTGAGEVSLVYELTPATIQSEVAEAEAARIEALIEDGLGLDWGEGSDRLTRRELLAALTISIDATADRPFTIGFDRSVLTSVITPIVTPLEAEMRNAQFRLVDGTVTLVEESRVGVAVDVPATVAAAQEAALAGADSVEVRLERVEPEFSSSDASSIQLNDLLAAGSTGLVSASDARKTNITVAAGELDGVMIAPGGSFSFLEAVGVVSEAAGYEIAYGMIYDASDGIGSGPILGGGVSQVATTLFQAAFWSGLPIGERHEHPWWIEAYGQPPSGMVGLDAFVDIRPGGTHDFAFENSTGNWIVISTQVTGTSVTVSIRGTNPGWTIRAEEPVISNRVAVDEDDEPREIDTPELAEGIERTVEAASDGFAVTITRTVSLGGETVSEDDFLSAYEPSPGVVLRGTGERSGAD